MKERTKLFLSMFGVVLFGLFAQIYFGNEGTWIHAGILITAIAFGWYGHKAKLEDAKENKE